MVIKWFGLLALMISQTIVCEIQGVVDETNFVMDLVEDIRLKDGFDTLITINDFHYTQFFSRSFQFGQITVGNFTGKMEALAQNRNNFVMLILNVEKIHLDFLNIDFLMNKNFAKILFIISKTNKLPTTILNKLFRTCWERRITNTLVYFDQDPTMTLYYFQISRRWRGWNYRNSTFPMNIYFPPVKNLKGQNIQISFDEEKLPLMMIYHNKVSGAPHMGGFQ